MFRIRTEKRSLPNLKTIYHASDEEKARLALNRVTRKMDRKIPEFYETLV